MFLRSVAFLISIAWTPLATPSAPAQCPPRWESDPATIGVAPLVFVSSFHVHDDGAGPTLYCAGGSGPAGGYVGRLSPLGWQALGSGFNAQVIALASYRSGGISRLYAGGAFTAVGGTPALRIASWDGTSWSPVGPGFSGTFDGVYCMAVHTDASGTERLYIGGEFRTALGQFYGLAVWDGTSLSFIPNAGEVWTLASASLPAGSPAQLFAGGRGFPNFGTIDPQLIARWNGLSWNVLGTGLGSDDDHGYYVFALAVHDEGIGLGPVLFIGGYYSGYSAPCSDLARWNGASWSCTATAPGSAVGGPPGVRALAVFDQNTGSGEDLYVGGDFVVPPGAITRWDGTSWSPLGSGLGTSLPNVHALKVFDDGGGPALYVGGSFTSAGGAPASNVARWRPAATAPAILVQPAAVTTNEGFTLSLAIQASGTPPLRYRWSKNGMPLVDGANVQGSSSAMLTIAPAALSDTGRYTAAVTNACSSVTSVPSNVSVLPAVGTEFCAGDGLDPMVSVACPCANSGAPGHGCANSTLSGGAQLVARGGISADATSGTDSVELLALGLSASGPAFFLVSDTTLAGGAILGDGITCLGGSLIRLGVGTVAPRASRFPDGGASLSQRSGVALGSGAVLGYQAVYRNAIASYCPPGVVNCTNAYRVTW